MASKISPYSVGGGEAKAFTDMSVPLPLLRGEEGAKEAPPVDHRTARAQRRRRERDIIKGGDAAQLKVRPATAGSPCFACPVFGTQSSQGRRTACGHAHTEYLSIPEPQAVQMEASRLAGSGQQDLRFAILPTSTFRPGVAHAVHGRGGRLTSLL